MIQMREVNTREAAILELLALPEKAAFLASSIAQRILIENVDVGQRLTDGPRTFHSRPPVGSPRQRQSR